MLETIQEILARFQLPLDAEAVDRLARAIAVALLVVLAFLVFVAAKRTLLRVIHAAVAKTRTDWDDRLARHRVFFWLAHLAPGLVIYLFAPEVLAGADGLISGLRGAAQVYMLVVGALALDAFFNGALEIYDTFAVSRQVPLKGVFQILKIVLYLTVALVVLATLLGESPIVLLSGLGVLASVLLLVFKDSILGFVAGIQLSTNRMLSRGDWLEMPSYGADGHVLEIALTTVKVQNWDKTITTIPTYALISDSFKNWRGMAESGGRRIKRAVYIDMSTVGLCTMEMLGRYCRFPPVAEHVASKRRDAPAVDLAPVDGSETGGRSIRLTNVGAFRAYLESYLGNHPDVRHDMTHLVRHLAPTAHGLPIEIYCFAAKTDWTDYEEIQAEIFDHVLAIAPEFDLRIFQTPSGADLERLGGALRVRSG